jgi:hypothetical protein
MNGAHRVRYLQVIEKIEPKRIKLERGSLAKIGQNKASTASLLLQCSNLGATSTCASNCMIHSVARAADAASAVVSILALPHRVQR